MRLIGQEVDALAEHQLNEFAGERLLTGLALKCRSRPEADVARTVGIVRLRLKRIVVYLIEVASLMPIMDAVNRHSAYIQTRPFESFLPLFNADGEGYIVQCRSCHLHEPNCFGFEFIAADGNTEANVVRRVGHVRFGPALMYTQICVL